MKQLENAEEALRKSSEVAVLTRGTSMRPMLREHKDIAVIERVSGRLRVNDVPLYRKVGYDRFVLHRVIRVKKNGYVIRGDNLYRNEYEVTDGDIIGVLKGFYRDGIYYDCKKSFKYKVYILLNRASYPFRYLWRFKLRPLLSKIKQLLLRILGKKK